MLVFIAALLNVEFKRHHKNVIRVRVAPMRMLNQPLYGMGTALPWGRSAVS